MLLQTVFIALIFLIGSSAQNTSSATFGLFGHGNCPPDGFDSLSEFDFADFVSTSRWYSIQQRPVRAQPLSGFYCVYAEYELARFCPFCLGRPKITVFNRALRNSVTGSETSVNFRAIVSRPRRHPARALVAPRFLPIGLFPYLSNYWVIDAGTYDDIVNNVPRPSGPPYEWAIITTGRPRDEGNSSYCYTESGMWMFARDPNPSEEIQTAIRARATDLGLDVTQWVAVEHDGCVY